MADPIQNAQFTLGLFNNGVQPLRESMDSRRQLALMFWKQRQEQAQQDAQRAFQLGIAREQMTNQREIASEGTDRAIALADATEARQLSAALRQLYGKYTALNPEEAKPLATFGKDEKEQYNNLQQVVGKLDQEAVIGDAEAKLYQRYLTIAGGDAKKLSELGKTPRERAENIIKLTGAAEEKQDKAAANSIRSLLGKIDAQIANKSTPTGDEIAAAQAAAIETMSKEGRNAYNKALGALKDPAAAIDKLKTTAPADYQKFLGAVSQGLSGLVSERQMKDRELQSLQGRRKSLEDAVANFKNPRLALYALGVDTEDDATQGKPTQPRRATLQDILSPKPSASVAPLPPAATVPAPAQDASPAVDPNVLFNLNMGTMQQATPPPVLNPRTGGVLSTPGSRQSRNTDYLADKARALFYTLRSPFMSDPTAMRGGASPGDPSYLLPTSIYYDRVRALPADDPQSPLRIALLQRAAQIAAQRQQQLPDDIRRAIIGAGATPIPTTAPAALPYGMLPPAY